jgi:hypothetical protein
MSRKSRKERNAGYCCKCEKEYPIVFLTCPVHSKVRLRLRGRHKVRNDVPRIDC